MPLEHIGLVMEVDGYTVYSLLVDIGSPERLNDAAAAVSSGTLRPIPEVN